MSTTEQKIRRFESRIEVLKDKLGIPGLSVAILLRQEELLARGFGYADVENHIRADAHTPFHISSLTKTFAAALIMRAVEDGRLDLDSPMSELLENAVIPVEGKNLHGYNEICEKIIEVRTSQSGKYDAFKPLLDGYNCDQELITLRHHLTHTSQGIPGTEYLYNGFLFSLLTQVIEEVTEVTFRQLLVEQIISPLKLIETFPSESDVLDQKILTLRAKPYELDDKQTLTVGQYPEGLGAASGMVSTVTDVSKFDIAMDNNLIVTEDSKNAMFTPHLSNDGHALPYGLGWFTQEHRGQKLVWHYGYESVFSSLILKVPKQSATLILMANSDGASASFPLGLGDVIESPFAVAFLDFLQMS